MKSNSDSRETLGCPSEDSSLVEALAGLRSDEHQDIVQKTRRAVRGSVLDSLARKQNRKRNAGVAILVAGIILLLLSPAIWSGIDDLVSGEYIADVTPMMTFLVVVFFSAVLAALVAGWKNSGNMRDGNRHT